MKVMLVTLFICVICVLAYTITQPQLRGYLSTLIIPSPPLPIVRYGEFPFRIDYEINGEQKYIEDTLVIQFSGVTRSLGIDSRLRWNREIRGNSSEESVFLWETEDGVRLYHELERSDVLMGERSIDDSLANRILAIKSVSSIRNGNQIGNIDEETLLKYHGVRIKEFEISSPIDNNFKYNWISRVFNSLGL